MAPPGRRGAELRGPAVPASPALRPHHQRGLLTALINNPTTMFVINAAWELGKKLGDAEILTLCFTAIEGFVMSLARLHHGDAFWGQHLRWPCSAISSPPCSPAPSLRMFGALGQSLNISLWTRCPGVHPAQPRCGPAQPPGLTNAAGAGCSVRTTAGLLKSIGVLVAVAHV